jgi:hypothetical protein
LFLFFLGWAFSGVSVSINGGRLVRWEAFCPLGLFLQTLLPDEKRRRERRREREWEKEGARREGARRERRGSETVRGRE